MPEHRWIQWFHLVQYFYIASSASHDVVYDVEALSAEKIEANERSTFESRTSWSEFERMRRGILCSRLRSISHLVDRPSPADSGIPKWTLPRVTCGCPSRRTWTARLSHAHVLRSVVAKCGLVAYIWSDFSRVSFRESDFPWETF